MLYHLFLALSEHYSFFNLFRYITFRAAFVAITALLFVWVLAPFFIRLFSSWQFTEKVKNVHQGLYDRHQGKQSTPTMGGLILVLGIIVGLLLWADIGNGYIQMSLFTLVWFAGLGFLDDYLKCVKKQSNGLSVRSKLLAQISFTALIAWLLSLTGALNTEMTFPFFKTVVVDLSYLYAILIFLVVVGTTNAVNITDGLDGLAAGCVLVAALAFALMAYISGHYGFSQYLNLPFVQGTGELVLVCTAMAGACLGFLWYNSYPASVFMGDTGALALGGMLGMLAVMIKQEILLVVVGGVFVIETVSVIIQVVHYKRTKQRFFLIAPLHHHFEMKGEKESKIVVRFWILAVLFALMSLCTLKVR